MGEHRLSGIVEVAAGAALFAVATAGPGLAFGPGTGMHGDGALGGVKIAEDNSPKPIDRIYFNYSYFNGPAFGAVPNGLFREVVGFEKTFLDTNASIEVRLPFTQTVDPFGTTFDIGDPSIFFKYALINDPDTGNVLSTGLGVTVPVTGGSVEIQPFIGGIWSPSPDSPFFIHGFTSALVPIAFPDGSFIVNDLGVGYVIPINGPILTSIIPAIEIHINTPVANIADTDLSVGIGATYDLGGQWSISAGAGVTAGPTPFDTYADIGLNFSF
jgi:hypothetical protein